MKATLINLRTLALLALLVGGLALTGCDTHSDHSGHQPKQHEGHNH